MKKLLFILLPFFLVGLTACKSSSVTGTQVIGQFDYFAPFAQTAPVIDGRGNDAAWEKAEWKPIDQVWLGPNDSKSNLNHPGSDVFSGRFKIVWTQDRLYYLVEIYDDYISTTRKDTPLNNPHLDDCLELFIDEDASGGMHVANNNAFAYHLSFYNGNVVDYVSPNGNLLRNNHLRYVVGNADNANKSNVYTWEVEMKVFDDKYPLRSNPDDYQPVKLHEGKTLGFAVAYCDAGRSNTREYFFGNVFIPGSDKNVAYMNAGVFAKLHLVSNVSTEGRTTHESVKPPVKFNSNSIVSIVQSSKANAAELTLDDVRAMVKEAVSLAGGLDGIVKAGDTVVLKPNLVLYHDQTRQGYTGPDLPVLANGVCTDWRVVKAVAELVREITGPSGKIWVMEGASKYTTTTAFNKLGYTKANIPEVDEFVALEKDSGSYVTSNKHLEHPNLRKIQLDEWFYKSRRSYYGGDGAYWVNKRMYEADVFINIPVVKNHWTAGVTGAIKNSAIGSTPPNVYGNASGDPGRNNRIPHDSLAQHQWIADYYKVLPSDFVVMDGLQGCDTGPVPGISMTDQPVTSLSNAQYNMRAVLASKDALAIDTVETNIINWDLDSIPYLKMLAQEGKTGNGNPKNITVVGKKVDDIRPAVPFKGRSGAPNMGAKKLTQAQMEKPAVTISSAQFAGQELKLNLNISGNTDKVDVYIDGKYAQSFNSNMTDIAVDAREIRAGARNITVYAYTRYMFHAAANTTAAKR